MFDEEYAVGTFVVVADTLGKSSELIGKGMSPFFFCLFLLDEMLILVTYQCPD